jgi:hypothetical protein
LEVRFLNATDEKGAEEMCLPSMNGAGMVAITAPDIVTARQCHQLVV